MFKALTEMNKRKKEDLAKKKKMQEKYLQSVNESFSPAVNGSKVTCGFYKVDVIILAMAEHTSIRHRYKVFLLKYFCKHCIMVAQDVRTNL